MKTFLYISAFLFCISLCPADIHPSQADFNHDGKVDLADLAEFASAWLWQSSCDTALPAELNTHYTGTTESSYWYAFTPTLSTYYYFSLCDGAEGYLLSLYDACGGEVINMTGEGCNFTEPLTAGQTYYLQVELVGEWLGDYDLFFSYAE